MNSNVSENITPDLLKRFFFWGIPLIIASSYCVLAFQDDLRLSITVLAAASALVMAALAIALYLGETGGIGWSPRTIMIIAAAFRLMFLFRAPELSDDIHRYLWDGMTLLSGNDPYAFAPSDAKSFAALLSQVNHPHLITIYPPAAQIIFSVGAFLGGILGIKILLTAADIAVCAMIVHLLSRMKMPPSRAAVYAWHPLPILEIAGSGHIDGAGIFFLMLAFMLLLPRHDLPLLPSTSHGTALAVAAGLAFSAAALVKLFPLVFFPIFLFLAREKGRGPFIVGAVIGSAALSIPFLPGLYNMFGTLDVYARNWEFAGFAFQPLHKIFPSGVTARLVLAVSFLLAAALLYASLFRKRENMAAFKTAYCVALLFLLLTPTLHPWYALYLACLLPFVPGTAGLVMTWAVLLTYRVLIPYTILGRWEDKDSIPAFIWLAAVGAPMLVWLAGKRGVRSIHGVKR